MVLKTIRIGGMEGELDAERLRQALGQVWGVREVAVDAGRGEIALSFDDRSSSLVDFHQAITEQGFRVEAIEG